MAESAPPQAKGSLCLSWPGLGSQCPSAPHVVTHVTECSSVLFAGALPSTQTLSKALALATVLEKATWSPDIQTLFPQFPLRGLPPISKPKYCRTQFSSPIFGGAYLPCPKGDALIPHACPLSGVEWSGWRVESDCHGSEYDFRERWFQRKKTAVGSVCAISSQRRSRPAPPSSSHRCHSSSLPRSRARASFSFPFFAGLGHTPSSRQLQDDA